MNKRMLRAAVVTVVAGAVALGAAAVASAKPILMPTVGKEVRQQRAIWQQHVFAPAGSLRPPAPPCPENGILPAPFSNCGLPEFPATTLPFPGNMAYWGGHVQTAPKVYIVYRGWGESGAFPASQPRATESITEGSTSATLACDPDGAGKYMADWVSELGGTQWAGEQTQYYQSDSSGAKQFITNPTDQLGGIGPMTATTRVRWPRRRPAIRRAPATPIRISHRKPLGRSRTSASPTWPTPTS